MTGRIFIADDDAHIRELEKSFLVKEDFAVESFADGDALLAACELGLPDLVVLDVMMPGSDGFSVCERLRMKSETLPILIVSARDDPYDRVIGLTIGSDDYLVKPFLPLELVARVKALLRRTGSTQKTQPSDLRFGALRLSVQQRAAFLGEEPLGVTPTEFDFLAYMIQNGDRAVSREELLKALWQYDWAADTRAADDLLKRLRKKLRAAGDNVRIETVWGYGFRLVNRSE